jgi:hypothetical protein
MRSDHADYPAQLTATTSNIRDTAYTPGYKLLLEAPEAWSQIETGIWHRQEYHYFVIPAFFFVLPVREGLMNVTIANAFVFSTSRTSSPNPPWLSHFPV